MYFKPSLCVMVLFVLLALMHRTDSAYGPYFIVRQYTRYDYEYDPDTLLWKTRAIQPETCKEEYYDGTWRKDPPGSCRVTQCVVDENEYGYQEWRTCDERKYEQQSANASCYHTQDVSLDFPGCCDKEFFCIGDEGFDQELLDKHNAEKN